MKNPFHALLYLSILLFAVSCDPENSDDTQPEAEDIIEIPDEHFKAALVSSNSIDTNGDRVGDRDIDLNDDGEIQRSEANLIEGLILSFDYAEIERYVELTGIENFINLKYLKIAGTNGFRFVDNSNSELITYDLTALKKLEYFELYNVATNYFEALDLSGLDRLQEVRLLMNRPNEFGEEFRIPINYMDVKLEGVLSLTNLDITNSFLNIDFCQVPSLKILNMFYLEGGEPEVFDFHCLTNLEWLNIGENSIHSLILKNNSVLNTLIAQDIGSADNGNYHYLEYICIDNIPEEFEQIASLRNDETVVVTDCEF